MCGLVGIIAKNKTGFYSVDRDIFNQLLYADVLRGSDATGIFGVKKNGNLDLHKQAAPAGWFLASKAYQENFSPKIISDYQMIIGHNRKATHGDRKDADAHPFYNEPICLVHNGMISNHKELCSEATVDSNAVCNAFAKGDFKETLKDIEGAFAFIWYNIKDKILYFIRNDRRPLFIVETNTTWILISEKEMAEWICKRNNTTIKSIVECVPSTLYSIELDNRELKEEKLDLVKPVSSTFHSTSTQQTYMGYPQNTSRQIIPFKNRQPVVSLSTVEPVPLLLSDETFQLINGKPQLDPDFIIERGKILHFEVEEVEDYKTPGFSSKLVRVVGALLNCPKTPVTVVGFLPLDQIESLSETGIAFPVLRADRSLP